MTNLERMVEPLGTQRSVVGDEQQHRFLEAIQVETSRAGEVLPVFEKVFIDGITDIPTISVITVTGIVAGSRGKRERRQIDRLLSVHTIRPIDSEIAMQVGKCVRQYGPSHSVDPIDALIAATATIDDLGLATLNIRHFPMLEALRRPY